MKKSLLPKKTIKKVAKADAKVAKLLEASKPPPVLGETKGMSANNFLGFCGRMLSGSKSDYSNRYPTHKVFFNGNIYDGEAFKIWFGDIDLSTDSGRIQALCDAMSETLFVTREMPYRFEDVDLARLRADSRGIHPDVIIFYPNPQRKQ